MNFNNIQIGKLADAIEEFKNIKLCHNVEADISDLECMIDTPSGKTLINCIIKKENLNGIKITLANGIEVKCANKHILQQHNVDVYADTLSIGDVIDTIQGDISIIDIQPIEDTIFYDIGIDSPHLYYDDNGIIHHNTIVTAVLSNRIEPYGRSIIIVPNKGLVMQTEADYINLGLDVGVYFGDRKDYNKKHTICTWQSLNNLLKKSKDGEIEIDINDFLEDVVAVVVDECLDGDTNVATPDGVRKIRDLQPGDKVINYSESAQTFKEDTVIKVHTNLTKSSSEPMLELVFDEGQVIKVTANHKFLTKLHGWVRADELTEEMEVIDINTSS